jgi:aspartate aminotransferase
MESEGVGPEHVVIGVGGKHCLYLAYQSLVDCGRGDQAIVLTPGWVSYRPQLELAGAEVIEVDSSVENDFKVKPEDLASALTSSTRVVTINNPSNPCGTTYTKDELAALADVIVRHNRDVGELYVVSDEIYEYLVYGGASFTAFANCHPDVAPYTITVNGLSKAYAMTGWRVGYAAAPVHDGGLGLIKAMSKLQAQMTTCLPAFVYPAIEVAITQAGDDVKRMQTAFAERAALIYRLIVEVPGFRCPRPTGAFYVFPDITAHFGKTSGGGRPINSALDFAEALLLEKHMAVVPGDDFGGCGPHHVRLSFACGPEQIETGMKRLGSFVAELS